MNKNEMRRQCLNLRKNVDIGYASKQVVQGIINSHVLEKYDHIGIYYPLALEISVLDLIDFYPQKSFYLPVTKEDIYFSSYKKNDVLNNGPFHTKEPAGKMVPREQIQCFIIPCVGVSRDNKRIGYGKGYYDRYLEGYEGSKIGVCHSGTSKLDIELEEFDVTLDYIYEG